jgi:hypothetical protein
MTITKNDLREFIEKKISDKKLSVYKEMDKMLLELVQPYYDKHISNELITLGEKARNLSQGISDAIYKYRIKDSSVSNSVYYLNGSVIDLDKTVRKDILQKIRDVATEDKYYYSLDSAKKDTEKYDDELLELCVSAIEKVKPFYKRIAEIDILKNEIFSVIKSERTGEKAYKKLIELGVDMEGFEPAEPQLPSIIKLSINVDLINK